VIRPRSFEVRSLGNSTQTKGGREGWFSLREDRPDSSQTIDTAALVGSWTEVRSVGNATQRKGGTEGCVSLREDRSDSSRRFDTEKGREGSRDLVSLREEQVLPPSIPSSASSVLTSRTAAPRAREEQRVKFAKRTETVLPPFLPSSASSVPASRSAAPRARDEQSVNRTEPASASSVPAPRTAAPRVRDDQRVKFAKRTETALLPSLPFSVSISRGNSASIPRGDRSSNTTPGAPCAS
jgi:hypothetical protein